MRSRWGTLVLFLAAWGLAAMSLRFLAGGAVMRSREANLVLELGVTLLSMALGAASGGLRGRQPPRKRWLMGLHLALAALLILASALDWYPVSYVLAMPPLSVVSAIQMAAGEGFAWLPLPFLPFTVHQLLVFWNAWGLAAAVRRARPDQRQRGAPQGGL